MIALEPHPAGVLLPVRAQPGARRNQITGEHNGHLKVAVTQVAEKGKANDAILEVLCESLNLRKSQVELISGETSREKKVLVSGIAMEILAKRITEAIAG
jgi:uncharacterized protein (TIGR00251 family)